jgi:hypothetical protein
MEILRKFKTLPLEQKSESFARVYKPITTIEMPELKPRGNRPLQMGLEEQLKALIYFHLMGLESGRELVQKMQEDILAQQLIAPDKGIAKSSFFEAINHRGLEQFKYIFTQLYRQTTADLPTEYGELGQLVAVDGSLIDATFSMIWADYRKRDKKAKIHLGLDINRGIPKQLFCTNGKADEKDYVTNLVNTDQTAVLDRLYHCHETFDLWQAMGRHFVCRIKANTVKTVLWTNPLQDDSIVFYDAVVILGCKGGKQTEIPVRVIGYRIGGSVYWLATDRLDLTAEQIAFIYKLRWDIESFFAWWKQYLNVYPLIARSHYGFEVQIFSGLITFLLLSLYSMKYCGQPVCLSILRSLQCSFYNDFCFALALFYFFVCQRTLAFAVKFPLFLPTCKSLTGH